MRKEFIDKGPGPYNSVPCSFPGEHLRQSPGIPLAGSN
jgi:hypothetical protein